MTLMGCVCGYFVFSGILTAFDYFIIKTSVICIKVKDDAVHIDLTMNQFDESITIAARGSKHIEENETTVANYFDTDGYLNQTNFFNDVIALINKFEASSKESNKSSKKDN